MWSFFRIVIAIFSGIRICTACYTGTFFLSDFEMAFWRIFKDKKNKTQDRVEVELYHYFMIPKKILVIKLQILLISRQWEKFSCH